MRRAKSARQPFRRDSAPQHHLSVHQRQPTALPVCRPNWLPTSVSNSLGFYSGHSPRLQGLKHFADHAKHRKPLRLLKPFLRYPCSSSRCSRRYPTLLGGTGTACETLPSSHGLQRNRRPMASRLTLISGDRMEKHPLTRQFKSFAVRHRLQQDSLASSHEPFMVELFTAPGFAGSPRAGQARFRRSPVESSPRQPGCLKSL